MFSGGGFSVAARMRRPFLPPACAGPCVRPGRCTLATRMRRPFLRAQTQQPGLCSRVGRRRFSSRVNEIAFVHVRNSAAYPTCSLLSKTLLVNGSVVLLMPFRSWQHPGGPSGKREGLPLCQYVHARLVPNPLVGVLCASRQPPDETPSQASQFSNIIPPRAATDCVWRCLCAVARIRRISMILEMLLGPSLGFICGVRSALSFDSGGVGEVDCGSVLLIVFFS